MKKILLIPAMLLVLTLVLAGCAGKTEEQTRSAAQSEAAQTEPEGTVFAETESAAPESQDETKRMPSPSDAVVETATESSAEDSAEASAETSAAAVLPGAGIGAGAVISKQENEETTAAETAAPEDKKLIAIDPGHQAHANSDQEPVGPGSNETKAKVSSGTAGDFTGAHEYQLNLDVALKLKSELLARGYDVLMIRETNDVDISNIERAEMANNAEADAFIRIHADGSENHSTHGCFTICQTTGNPYNADIYEECNLLAESVLEGLVASTGAKDRGVMRSDTYSGINWSRVPVTIVEMGFMSNREEDELMQTEEYQEKIAKGLADGLDLFFSRQ